MLFVYENKIKKGSLQVCHVNFRNMAAVFRQRASLSVPLGDVDGSMTVEATMVFPIFLFAVFSIMEFFCVLSFQNDMQISMNKAAVSVADMRYAIEIGEEDEPVYSAATATYVYCEVMNSAMRKRADEKSGIVGGSAGISFIRSDFSKENLYMDMEADYIWKIPFYNRLVAFNQRCTFAPWTGKSIKYNGYDGERRCVYVTKTGRVYHLKEDCTYLRMSIKKVKYSGVGTLRNESGGKYKPCEVCCREGVKKSGAVYITDYGDRYHVRKECKTLLRYIQSIDISEVGRRTPCTKCGVTDDSD